MREKVIYCLYSALQTREMIALGESYVYSDVFTLGLSFCCTNRKEENKFFLLLVPFPAPHSQPDEFTAQTQSANSLLHCANRAINKH